MVNEILRGVFIGIISGVFIGFLILISDGIFYSKFITNFEMARKYSKPLNQMIVFALISVFYGAVQGGIFAWLSQILPVEWLARGVVFGLISYLIMSRHFMEGFAFMNPKYMPTKLSIYLSIEFLIAYLIQGIFISRLF